MNANTTLPTRVFDPLALAPDPVDSSNNHAPAKEDFGAMLDARRFDINNPPPRPPPIFTLDGHTIATAGNIVAVQAKAKAGKTAAIGATLAATMLRGEDFLGVQCDENSTGAVVHLDTEQSRFDHFGVVTVALRRANLPDTPRWFRSYCVTDMNYIQRREAFFYELARCARETGKILCAVVDGIGDLVSSPNNEEEAILLLDRMHSAAIKYDTAILCVLHENPGEGQKTRGHLGSQLERKAETNLRLEKDGDGVTVVYTERARHCHIPAALGPRFAWDDEAKMHLPVATRKNAANGQKLERRKETLEDCFHEAEPGGMQRVHLLAKIMEVDKCAAGTARDRFDEMRDMGLIAKSDTTGKWKVKL